MKTGASELDAGTSETAGFSTLDDKGRVSLPKAVRASLGIHAGSSLAYVVFDNAVLLVPQDEHLADLQRQAIAALAEAGLTVDDLLERLPEARADVTREAYSPAFLARLRAMRKGRESGSGEEEIEHVEQSGQAE